MSYFDFSISAILTPLLSRFSLIFWEIYLAVKTLDSAWPKKVLIFRKSFLCIYVALQNKDYTHAMLTLPMPQE